MNQNRLGHPKIKIHHHNNLIVNTLYLPPKKPRKTGKNEHSQRGPAIATAAAYRVSLFVTQCSAKMTIDLPSVYAL
jgi:hypothetical protein